MAKQRDLKGKMGGLFARTEAEEEQPTVAPPAAVPAIREAKPTPESTPTTQREEQAEPEQADLILSTLELELRRRGLSGRDLDTAITAFAVARATEKAERARVRSRRDWSQAARLHGRPQTFRLWEETIQRLDALAERHPDKLKRDLINALLDYALAAAEAGDLEL